MASLSNALSPGTFARIEGDGLLFIADGKGAQESAPLPEPAYGVELEHEAGLLSPEFYGEPVRPVMPPAPPRAA
jgi:hypothetical protein